MHLNYTIVLPIQFQIAVLLMCIIIKVSGLGIGAFVERLKIKKNLV